MYIYVIFVSTYIIHHPLLQIRVRGLPLLEQYRLPGPGPQRHLLHLDAAGGGLGAAQPRPRLLTHPHHLPLQVGEHCSRFTIIVRQKPWRFEVKIFGSAH